MVSIDYKKSKDYKIAVRIENKGIDIFGPFNYDEAYRWFDGISMPASVEDETRGKKFTAWIFTKPINILRTSKENVFLG